MEGSGNSRLDDIHAIGKAVLKFIDEADDGLSRAKLEDKVLGWYSKSAVADASQTKKLTTREVMGFVGSWLGQFMLAGQVRFRDKMYFRYLSDIIKMKIDEPDATH